MNSEPPVTATRVLPADPPVVKLKEPLRTTPPRSRTALVTSTAKTRSPEAKARETSVPSSVTVCATGPPVVFTRTIALAPPTVPAIIPAKPLLGRTRRPRPAVRFTPAAVTVALERPITTTGLPSTSWRSKDIAPVTDSPVPVVTVAPVRATRTYGPAGRPSAAVGRVLTATVAVPEALSAVPVPPSVRVPVRVAATPSADTASEADPPATVSVCVPTVRTVENEPRATVRVSAARVTVTEPTVKVWPAMVIVWLWLVVRVPSLVTPGMVTVPSVVAPGLPVRGSKSKCQPLPAKLRPGRPVMPTVPPSRAKAAVPSAGMIAARLAPSA